MKRKKHHKPSKSKKHGAMFITMDSSNPTPIDLMFPGLVGSGTFFHYIISRAEVEKCDTSRLIHDLRLDPNNPLLKAGPGSVIFSVSGYDEDHRDLLLIPEFRAFVEKAQKSAPCWLYFAMPQGAWLRIILVAGNADCPVEDAGDGTLTFGISNYQIAWFMNHQIKVYDRLCKMMGIDQNTIDDHLRASSDDSFPNFSTSSMMD